MIAFTPHTKQGKDFEQHSKCYNYFRIEPINNKKLDGALKHNLRLIPKELDGEGAIFPDRVHLNEYFGPTTPEGIKAELNRHRAATANGHKSNLVPAIEVMTTLPRDVHVNEDEFFRASRQWVSDYFRVPIVCAAIHRDEENLHQHIIAAPIRDGKMAADVIKGDRTAITKHGKDFAMNVVIPSGLPPVIKLKGPKKQKAVDEVFAKLRASNHPVQNLDLWPIFSEYIRVNPLPMLQALSVSNSPYREKSSERMVDDDGVILDIEQFSLTCVGQITTQRNQPNSPEDPGIYRRYTPAQFVGTFTGLMN